MENKITNYIDYLFAVALQKCKNIHDAEDMTQEVILAALTFEKADSVTASLGAVKVREGEEADKACIRVDEALYAAKAAGRNRVVFCET